MGQLILVTGPTRSGKSEWAEGLAEQTQAPVVYVATAQCRPDDPEWQARIAQHRHRRPTHWRTLEVPTDLAGSLTAAQPEECWLVDSLGTWLASRWEQSDRDWEASMEGVIQAIAACPSTLILVAEETGWGVVPAYPSGRTFRDRLGTLTRRVGAIADAVYLVVAGYAIPLHAIGIAVPPLSKP